MFALHLSVTRAQCHRGRIWNPVVAAKHLYSLKKIISMEYSFPGETVCRSACNYTAPLWGPTFHYWYINLPPVSLPIHIVPIHTSYYAYFNFSTSYHRYLIILIIIIPSLSIYQLPLGPSTEILFCKFLIAPCMLHVLREVRRNLKHIFTVLREWTDWLRTGRPVFD